MELLDYTLGQSRGSEDTVRHHTAETLGTGQDTAERTVEGMAAAYTAVEGAAARGSQLRVRTAVAGKQAGQA